MRRFAISTGILAALALLSACAGQPAPPTPTPAPTVTVIVTESPAPVVPTPDDPLTALEAWALCAATTAERLAADPSMTVESAAAGQMERDSSGDWSGNVPLLVDGQLSPMFMTCAVSGTLAAPVVSLSGPTDAL